MCRLFGFRSIINSQVHQSLVHADNALRVQSGRHPDGWGVSYYIKDTPHIIKSDKAAINDTIFKQVSGIVSSQTVLAHIRKATFGTVNILNTHPFQYGKWSFAHNGNIKAFDRIKEKLLAEIPDQKKKYVIGSTDSEVVFYFLLAKINQRVDIFDNEPNLEDVMLGAKEAIEKLLEIIGELCLDQTSCPQTESYLTFILTNGPIMIGFCGGQQLYYSTYKKKCDEAATCPSYSPECEAPSKTGFVNHLIFSSEPLHDSNIWIQMKPYDMIGIDKSMKLKMLNIKK
jgi:predicted glutamine amidotransferase